MCARHYVTTSKRLTNSRTFKNSFYRRTVAADFNVTANILIQRDRKSNITKTSEAKRIKKKRALEGTRRNDSRKTVFLFKRVNRQPINI